MKVLVVIYIQKIENQDMGAKKIHFSGLKDPVARINVLYKSSKGVFIAIAFIFFVSYFFVSASFFDEYVSLFLLHLYIGFVLSFSIFLGCATFSFGYKKIPSWVLILLCLVWSLMGLGFLIPIFL